MRFRVVAIALLVSACAGQTPYVKDGVEYGVTKGTFRGRWWSYYERGASFLAGEFFDEAAADFEKAVVGRSRDAWTARTYGLHFVEYFPNRELGVTHYYAGRLDEAEQYLRTSLSHVDTARAHHYLDLVTKKRLDLGSLTDEADPRIETSFDGTKVDVPLVVSSRTVELGFDATDDIGVETVTVDGRPLHQRGSAREIALDDALHLEEGVHEINVEASDLSGKTARQVVALTVDLSGPALGIADPVLPLVTQDSAIRLRGAAADPNGVVAVRLDGRDLATSPGSEQLGFETDLPLADGENVFVLTAEDVAGNETATAVAVFRGDPESTEARMWLFRRRVGPIEVAALDPERLATLVAAALDDPAGSPLEIEMKYPTRDLDEYRKQELRVAGRVRSENDLASFQIQGDTYPVIADARTIEFSRRVPIDEGENPIEVAAADVAGHEDRWEGLVNGRPVFLDEYKMKVALLHVKGEDEARAALLNARLVGRLMEVRNRRFRVLERQNLEQILLEQQIGSSDLADERFALQLGKTLPVDVFLYCQVFPREKHSVEVLTRAFDVETTEVLAAQDTSVLDWTDGDELARRSDEIADGIAGKLPRLSAAVLAVAGKRVWIDVGRDHGVRSGMKAVVAYEAIPPEVDESTGVVLREPIYDALGLASIVGVEDTSSKLGELVVMIEGDEVAVTQGMPAFTL